MHILVKIFLLEMLQLRCTSANAISAAFLRKSTGLRFVEYLNEKRLGRAEILLQNTNKKIGDIAMQCGFHSDSYFIRQFKKKFGMTPKEYSLKILNEGTENK